MPVLNLALGKDQLNSEQKSELIKSFTNSAAKISGLPEQSFIILINELDDENIGIGGQTLQVRKAAMK